MSTEPPALTIFRVEVGPDRVEAIVRVASQRCMRTTSFPGLASRVVEVLPGVVRHRCECGSSHGIEAELADTETPHLLEHIALELMVLSGSPRTLRGDTRWDFNTDGPGVFRLTLEYDDDLVALEALKRGTTIVEMLLADDDVPEIEVAVGDAVVRLKELRATSA